MKKFPFLAAGLALLSMSLTQCAVTTVDSDDDVSYGYGATGRLATNAMWAGATAYGIHERNEIRRDRVDHAVNHYHGPRHGGGSRPHGGGGHRGGGRHR